jgi:hypothetical protein
VAAGRLGHVDLGKTITTPMGGTIRLTGELVQITMHGPSVHLDIRTGRDVTFTVLLTPHQLVTITGKEAAA